MAKTKNKKIVKNIIISIFIILYFLIYNFNNDAHKTVTSTISVNPMEQKFSSSGEVTNTVYYIAADGTSSNGTDINKPMSLQQAKTKTYYANDKILFKSGDIFYDSINFNMNLADGETVYIGSYGEGERPIITTAKVLNNVEAWTKYGENVYRLDMSNNDYFTGMLSQDYNVGFFKDEHGNIYGMRKSDTASLTTDGDFCCENSYLYLYSREEPSSKYGKITLAVNVAVVKLKNGMRIENLTIQDTGGHGINTSLQKLKDIHINNCIIQNIGGSVLKSDFTRYGNGIEFYGTDVENIVIKHNVIRNTYDVAFTCQGHSGSGKNIDVSNNIFISNTQNCEFWYTATEGGIQSFKYYDNISVNTGKGWGYDARPDKGVASDFLMYTFNPQNLDIELKNNKIFNSRRLNFLTNPEKLKIINSDNNYIYTDKELYLLRSEYKLDKKDEFISEYGIEENSKIFVLGEDKLQKISNKEIMNSNNYNEIKKYYEDLENEIQLNDALKTTVEQYDDFQEEYKNELDKMTDIETNIFNLRNNVKNLTPDNVWDDIDSLYKIGEDIISKYKNKQIKLDKQQIEDILLGIKDIGDSYINIIDVIQITEKVPINNLNELLENANNLKLNLEENSDLDLEDENNWYDLIKDYLEKIQDEKTSQKDKSYNYIKTKNMLIWASNMLDLYIDEYIQNHPITITYSITELTNKDLIATLNIGEDCNITNNNKQNTYTFKDNGLFIFEYTRRGREFQAEAIVSNIDKKAPVIIGVKDGQVYGNYVTCEVEDENLDEITLIKNGVKQENYENGNKIKENGNYQIIATDKAGNTTTVNFKIFVKMLQQIELTTMPTKKEYIQNYENLDLTGGILTLTYNDGTTETIDLTNENVKVKGFDNIKLGINTITVEYEGKTTSFGIQIVSNPETQKNIPKEDIPKEDNAIANVKFPYTGRISLTILVILILTMVSISVILYYKFMKYKDIK